MTAADIQARFKLAYGKRKEVAGSSDFLLDVDLALPGQGITGIYGASGSGKTTLLRCIAGLIKATNGALTVNGKIWQNDQVMVPTHKRSLAYVFQEAGLFPHLSVAANLDFAIRRARSVDARFFEHILELMDISRLMQRLPDQLSGGEKQRVAIARAFLVRPTLLLMDEPLASLDSGRKQEILPYLERLHEEYDLPVLYVSHSIDELARLADYLIVMEQGRAVVQGTITDVLSRADLPFAPGDETGVVLPAKVVARDAQWHLLQVAFAGGSVWVRDGGDTVGHSLRIRILARDISLALSCHDDTSIQNRLPATVIDVTDDRDEAMVLTRLLVGSSTLIARITKRSAAHLQLSAGQELWAQIKSVAVVR